MLWSLTLKTSREHFSRARDILQKGPVFVWKNIDCQHFKKVGLYKRIRKIQAIEEIVNEKADKMRAQKESLWPNACYV